MGTCRKSRLAVSGEGLWSLQASACIRAHLGSKLRTAAHLTAFSKSIKVMQKCRRQWEMHSFGVLIEVNRAKRWPKTDWPFSMENISCRWGGGGVPAYLPPMFLRTKQAMSAMRTSSTTAHMVPMIQLCVEKPLCWLSTPGKKRKKKSYQPSTFHVLEYLNTSSVALWDQSPWNFGFGRKRHNGCQMFSRQFHVNPSRKNIRQKKCKLTRSRSRTRTFTPVDSALSVAAFYQRLEVKSLKSTGGNGFLSSHLWLESG